MSKEDLIKHIANCAGITNAQAKRALDCMEEGIIDGLKKSGKTQIMGIGRFQIVKKPKRTRRIAATGKAIIIPKSLEVEFSVSKKLSDELTTAHKKGISKKSYVSLKA